METQAAATWSRFGSLLVEEATRGQGHAVAVSALVENALDALRGLDQGADLIELATDEPTPVLFRTRAARGGQQAADVREGHAEAGAKSDQHQEVDRVSVVAALAADATGLGQHAGVFVVADRRGAKAARSGELADAQGGGSWSAGG